LQLLGGYQKFQYIGDLLHVKQRGMNAEQRKAGRYGLAVHKMETFKRLSETHRASCTQTRSLV